MSSSTPRPTILFLECSMPSTLRPRGVDQLGVVAVVGLVLVEDVAERVPVGGALHAQHQRVVGVADLVPVLPAGDGVGAGRQHLVDRIEAAAEQAGLRAVAVERNAEREHLAGADQARGLDDVLGRDVVERADLVVLAPAAPVRSFFGGLLDRLLAHLDVHRSLSRICPRSAPSADRTERAMLTVVERWRIAARHALRPCGKRLNPSRAPAGSRPGVNGMSVSGLAPSGRSASLMAFMTQPGAPAVPASPAPLAPSSRVGGRRHHVADLDVGHLGRHRHQIVGHVAVEQLAALVVEAVLEQRAADALHDAAAHLLVDQLRIDDGAAVLHAPVLQQLDEAGVGVDLELARLDAVGEGERPGARHIVARRHQLGLEAGRQRVGAEIGDAGELGERQALGAAVAVDHDAVADVERLGLRPAGSRPRTASTLARSALPACQAASPPMPAAREAQVPPP